MGLKILKISVLFWVIHYGLAPLSFGQTKLLYVQNLLASQKKISDCTFESSLFFSDESHSGVTGIDISFTQDQKKYALKYFGSTASRILHPLDLMELSVDSSDDIMNNPYVAYQVTRQGGVLKIFVDPKVKPEKIIGVYFLPDASDYNHPIRCGFTDRAGRVRYEDDLKRAGPPENESGIVNVSPPEGKK